MFITKPSQIIKYRRLPQTRACISILKSIARSRKESHTTERIHEFPSPWNNLPPPKLVCCSFVDNLQLPTPLSCSQPLPFSYYPTPRSGSPLYIPVGTDTTLCSAACSQLCPCSPQLLLAAGSLKTRAGCALCSICSSAAIARLCALCCWGEAKRS